MSNDTRTGGQGERRDALVRGGRGMDVEFGIGDCIYGFALADDTISTALLIPGYSHEEYSKQGTTFQAPTRFGDSTRYST